MRKYFLIFGILALVFGASSAFAATGTIVPGFDKTKVCHNVDCDTPTPGIINFRPTGVADVIVDDQSGLSGYIWGSELGWIKLNPAGAGVTMDEDGTLGGKAWSQVAGWINFAPTGQGVSIDPTSGNFEGWAWAGGPYGGWIPFDCDVSDRCVKTTWRHEDDGGGGCQPGEVCGSTDACLNMGGFQNSVPVGYWVDADRNCWPNNELIDECPNIEGNQPTVPSGYFQDSVGNCFPDDLDYCQNISGVQTSVPAGYVVDINGNCVTAPADVCPQIGLQTSLSECPLEPPTDRCLNLDGLQSSVPDGYSATDGICLPSTLDMCRNIDGNQTFVPNGLMLDANGDCVTEPADYCENLGGYQTAVPDGFYEQNGNCFFGSRPAGGALPGATEGAAGSMCEIIAFRFVPDRYRIPSNNVFLKTIVKAFDLPKLDCYSVDLVSTALVVIAITLFAFIVARIVRKILVKDKKDDDNEDDYLPPRQDRPTPPQYTSAAYTPPATPGYTPPSPSYIPPSTIQPEAPMHTSTVSLEKKGEYGTIGSVSS